MVLHIYSSIVSHQSWCRHGVSRSAPAGPPTDKRVSNMGRFNQQVNAYNVTLVKGAICGV